MPNKYNFRMYIPFAHDEDLLEKAVFSIIPQMNEWSLWGNDGFWGSSIVIINNSGSPLPPKYAANDLCDEIRYPFELTHAQECNYMIEDVLHTEQPFIMSTHTDSELLPGAMENLLDKYEQVKDSKWGVIYSAHGGHIFCIFNPQFFVETGFRFDPFRLPFYYMDNEVQYLFKLFGYGNYTTDSSIPLVKHVSSHFLKNDSYFRRKNDIAFPNHGKLYFDTWGGMPGHETVTDPYSNGVLRRK